MLEYIADITKGFYSLISGMTVTAQSFFKKPVTVQYPLEKEQLPPRFRGVLGVKKFYNAETIESRSNFFANKKLAPCIDGCPANTPAREYVTLTGERRFKEAIVLLKNHYPFLGVLGRICSAPCETVCSRGTKAGSKTIAIRKIKRFLGDYEKTLPIEKQFDYKKMQESPKKSKAAVIGAGPAGLIVAWYLSLRGYPVTIFEKHPVPGGYLATGIPKYRLSREVLFDEVKMITDLGTVIQYNTEIGKEIQFEELQSMGYKAVFVGAGALKANTMNIPEEEAQGVIPAESFLEDVNLDRPYNIGKCVCVIGGGFTAMDACRSSIRLGAKVHLFYRRTQHEMTANEDELEDSHEEGVQYHFLTAPKRVIAENGKVAGMEFIRCELGKMDASSRRSPVHIPGTEFIHECDTILTAVSRTPSLPWLPEDIECKKNGTIKVNETTMETTRKGVFAGGDVVLGAKTVIEAIAQGKMAAHAMAEYLGE